MHFEITHRTDYVYSAPVSLEPHTVRLRPRCDPWQRLQAFDLQVTPEPVGRSEFLDLDGNSVCRLWFKSDVEELHLTARSVVETTRRDPFDFLLETYATSLPIRWPAAEERHLVPYRLRRQPSRLVDDFVEQILDEVGGVTTMFLTTLARRIAEGCRYLVRPEGEPALPAMTLSEGSGACRDLAVLFVDAARSGGLPARFVSGYQASSHHGAEAQLHAWAEVFLPGAGWRGFDPSHGLAVVDEHVAVAAAAEPLDATPVEGTFRGSAVRSSMTVEVDVQTPDLCSQVQSSAG